jgi:hypothetical protein
VTIAVDLESLTEAFEDASTELSYFVDRETGEVILVSETLGFIEAAQQRASMAETPARFVQVPISSEAEFVEDVERYLDDVSDPVARRTLDEAVWDDNPSSAVAKVLDRYGDLGPKLRRFRRSQFRRRALAWLVVNGLQEPPALGEVQ